MSLQVMDIGFVIHCDPGADSSACLHQRSTAGAGACVAEGGTPLVTG